jgi:hypothetical protein
VSDRHALQRTCLFDRAEITGGRVTAIAGTHLLTGPVAILPAGPVELP